MFSVGIDQGRWGEPRFSWQWGWRVVGKWTAGDYTQLYSPGQSDTLTTKIWSLPAWPPSPRLGYPGLSCLQARLWGLSSIFCKLFLKEEIMIASEGLGGEPHSCHLRIIFHIKIPNAQSLPLIKFPYINFAINSEQNWFPARTWSSYQTPHPKGGGRETSQIGGGGLQCNNFSNVQVIMCRDWPYNLYNSQYQPLLGRNITPSVLFLSNDVIFLSCCAITHCSVKKCVVCKCYCGTQHHCVQHSVCWANNVRVVYSV